MFNKNKSKEVKAFNVYDILIHGLFGLIIGLAMLVLAPGGGLPDKLIRTPLVLILNLSLIHISEPTRRTERSRMPSSA